MGSVTAAYPRRTKLLERREFVKRGARHVLFPAPSDGSFPRASTIPSPCSTAADVPPTSDLSMPVSGITGGPRGPGGLPRHDSRRRGRRLAARRHHPGQPPRRRRHHHIPSGIDRHDCPDRRRTRRHRRPDDQRPRRRQAERHSGNNTSRILKVESGETVRLAGLMIAGGSAGSENGGGIDNFGTLTVSNCVFFSNSATDGGGLANESGGTATVRNSVFTGNSATGNFPHGDGGGLA